MGLPTKGDVSKGCAMYRAANQCIRRNDECRAQQLDNIEEADQCVQHNSGIVFVTQNGKGSRLQKLVYIGYTKVFAASRLQRCNNDAPLCAGEVNRFSSF